MARRHFSSQALVLIVISIAINMIGGQLASMVKLPIFLDSIGTLISAVLLGPVIGMLTGLLTNLLWGLLTDPIAAAFAPVAMVIGLVAGWLARAGWFRTLPKVVVSGVIITLAVTVVAVPLRTALVRRRDRKRSRFVRCLDALDGAKPGGVGGDYGDRREPGR